MQASEKWKALIGLGFRGSKVVTGTEAVYAALEKRKAKLVILAVDAAARTKRDFQHICAEQKVPWVELGGKEVLGMCTGQSPRAVLAITDQLMARAILGVVSPENAPGKA